MIYFTINNYEKSYCNFVILVERVFAEWKTPFEEIKIGKGRKDKRMDTKLLSFHLATREFCGNRYTKM
jgi:hypothetical protein